MIGGRSIWILAVACALAAACDFDFDAYDPRGASSQVATGSGGLEGASSTHGTGGGVVSATASASTAAVGGIGGAAGMGGTGGDDITQACISKYGAVPGFLLCEATPSSCSFNANVAMTGGNCTGACQLAGGMCTDAFSNAPPDLCVPSGMKDCASVGSANDICACTL